MKEYGWKVPSQHEEVGPRLPDPELDRHIRASVNRALQGHGFTETEADVADFVVDYFLDVSTWLEVMRIDRTEESPDGVLVYSHLPDSDLGYHSAVWGVGPPRSYERVVHRRYLTIKVFEPGSGKVIWRGTATGEVDTGQSSDLQSRRIDEAIRKTLRDFPPK